MEIKWCWRCQEDIPMLDEKEFKLCLKAKEYGKRIIDDELEKRKIENYIWIKKDEISNAHEKLRFFIEMYRVLTGFKETNPNAIWHHLLSEHEADCPKCKKPLRTKEARYCVACGFGKENLNKETPPLIKRHFKN